MPSPLSAPAGPLSPDAPRHAMPVQSIGRGGSGEARQDPGERFDEVFRGKAGDIDGSTGPIEMDNATGQAAPDGTAQSPLHEAAPSDDTASIVVRNRGENAPHADHETAARDLRAPASDRAELTGQSDHSRAEAHGGDSLLADMADQQLAASTAPVAEQSALPVSQRPANSAYETAVLQPQGADQGNSGRSLPGQASPGVVRMGAPDRSSDTGAMPEAGAKTHMKMARSDGVSLTHSAAVRRSAPPPLLSSDPMKAPDGMNGTGAGIGETEGRMRPAPIGRADPGHAPRPGIASIPADPMQTDRGQGVDPPNRATALPLAGAGGGVQMAATTAGEAAGTVSPGMASAERLSPSFFDQAAPAQIRRFSMRGDPARAMRGDTADAADPREPGARNAGPMRPAMPGQIKPADNTGAQSPATSDNGPPGISEHLLRSTLGENASDVEEHGVQTMRDTRIGPPAIQPASPPRPEAARHVAVQIAEAARSGGERPIDLNLNPAELGRVRITLTGADGMMHVTVSAERGETLDLMRRHIELLSEAFRDIGYGGSSFAFSHDRDPPDRAGSGQSHHSTPQDAPPSSPIVANAALPPRALPVDRLDIRL